MAGRFSLRELWHDYQKEVLFFLVLAVCVGASTWLSQFIPEPIFDHVLTPALNVCTITVSLMGAWTIFRHSEGLRVRKLWAFALLFWCFGDLFYLICYIIAPMHVMNMGAAHLTTFELLFGNLLGLVMVLYPTETLRPGWLNWKIILWQVLPMFALVALDYVVPYNFWPIIALYPYVLLALVLTHIRAYRTWCEENYSSMDNIDVQWIVRYCIMLFIIGANYVYMCSTHGHTRGFTQQWFVVFMLAYSTEQIIFRKDPWRDVQRAGEDPDAVAQLSDSGLLERWMQERKPYLNPDFKLMDLREVLPMNRTYLSQFVRDTYGSTFYQWANRYRIEEAKRLLLECPEMKMDEVAARSGFSSPTVFSRTFARVTGVAPKSWRREQ